MHQTRSFDIVEVFIELFLVTTPLSFNENGLIESEVKTNSFEFPNLEIDDLHNPAYSP